MPSPYTLPSIVLSHSVDTGHQPITNPIKISERVNPIAGSSFQAQDGVGRQTVITHAQNADGSFVQAGSEFTIELFLNHVQYVSFRQFVRLVGSGDHARSFNLPANFHDQNYPANVRGAFTLNYAIGSTPMEWILKSVDDLTPDPISNDVRGYYRVNVVIKSVLPF